MAETTEKTPDKKLSVGSTKTLTLKPRGVEQSVVRQNFSHGRTKQVVVEKVRTRTLAKTPGKAEAPAPAAPAPPAAGSTTAKRSAAAATTTAKAAPSAAPAAP